MIRLPRLYAVADGAFGDPVQIAKELFDGGGRLIQVRHKSVPARTLSEEVEAILRIAPAGTNVIVNDRADVARISGASGVHLGQEDLHPAAARKVLIDGQIIGYSTHNMAQALDADQQDVEYIAVGPIFETTTKKNPDPVVGLELLTEICSRVNRPVVAIGGITLESSSRVLECGVASVAVIGDLLRHRNIASRTREWVRHLEG